MKNTLSNKKKRRYPYVGICTIEGDSFSVLFTEKNKGTVIYREDGGKIGTHSTIWDEECFSLYEHSVSISNQTIFQPAEQI